MTDRELMLMALDALEYVDNGVIKKDYLEVTIKALRDRLAQPEPEPAFYVIQATDRFGEGYEQTYWEDPLGFPVYTKPVHAIDISQERVDETAKDRHESVEYLIPVSWYGDQPLYAKPICTAPTKREWVGLSAAETENITRGSVTFLKVALETEAKLKEKNSEW